jgi:hypothetical protein
MLNNGEVDRTIAAYDHLKHLEGPDRSVQSRSPQGSSILDEFPADQTGIGFLDAGVLAQFFDEMH